MKKLRSKKGLTLVELVVTVAILGMVAGMGIGVVSRAIINYSNAQTIANEQDVALQVESFITGAAKISSSVQEKVSSSIPQADVTAYYLRFDDTGKLQTIRHVLDQDSALPTVTVLTYDNVSQIDMAIREQKANKDDSRTVQCFVYLDYEIKMMEGYTIKGTTILNNADPDYTGLVVNTDSFVDFAGSITLTKDNSSNAIMIIK